MAREKLVVVFPPDLKRDSYFKFKCRAIVGTPGGKRRITTGVEGYTRWGLRRQAKRNWRIYQGY